MVLIIQEHDLNTITESSIFYLNLLVKQLVWHTQKAQTLQPMDCSLEEKMMIQLSYKYIMINLCLSYIRFIQKTTIVNNHKSNIKEKKNEIKASFLNYVFY